MTFQAAPVPESTGRYVRDFERWMEVERGYAFTTRVDWSQHLRQADRWIRTNCKRTILQARREDLQAFLARFKNPKTRNSYLVMLRAFFSWALEKGRRKTDPTGRIRRHPEPLYLPRPLSSEQVRAIRVAARSLGLRHQVIVDLALFAGPRRAEIAALSWSDVNFHDLRIRFKGKGSKDGVIPMHPDLASLLYRWRMETVRHGDTWVFRSNRGSHLRPASIWRLIRETGDLAGVKMQPHQLRHCFATELLDAGADVRAVQELLRHASLSSTQIYTKVAVRRLEEDVARLRWGGGVSPPPKDTDGQDTTAEIADAQPMPLADDAAQTEGRSAKELRDEAIAEGLRVGYTLPEITMLVDRFHPEWARPRLFIVTDEDTEAP